MRWARCGPISSTGIAGESVSVCAVRPASSIVALLATGVVSARSL